MKERNRKQDAGQVVFKSIPKRDWPEGYWEKLDDLRSGLHLDDIPPLGGILPEIGNLDER